MQPRLTPIIVNAPQRTPDWFNARLGNVTGSKVTNVMSYYAVQKNHIIKATEYYTLNEHLHDAEWMQTMLEQYPTEYCLQAGVQLKESAVREGYRKDLVTERITGMQADLDPYVNKAMIWGQMHEPEARAFYQLIHRHKVEDAPLMLHPNLLCGASPDGLVIDVTTGELGNLEIKCLTSKNHLYKVIRENKVPEDYRDQIQMQMWINGRDWCDFVAYDSRVKEGLHLFVKRVERDNFFIDNVLEPAVRRFLDECDQEERQFYAIMKKRSEEARQRVLGEVQTN